MKNPYGDKDNIIQSTIFSVLKNITPSTPTEARISSSEISYNSRIHENHVFDNTGGAMNGTLLGAVDELPRSLQNPIEQCLGVFSVHLLVCW